MYIYTCICTCICNLLFIGACNKYHTWKHAEFTVYYFLYTHVVVKLLMCTIGIPTVLISSKCLLIILPVSLIVVVSTLFYNSLLVRL